MGLRLARAHAGAGELVGVEIDQAHVRGRHEALADERGRAEGEIVADADGDVAAVAVGVVALPEPAAHIADALLDHLDGGRIEKAFDLGGRLRVGAGRPLELVVGNAGRGVFLRGAGGGGLGAGGGENRRAAAEDVARRRRKDRAGGRLLSFAKKFLGVAGGNDGRHGTEVERCAVKIGRPDQTGGV